LDFIEDEQGICGINLLKQDLPSHGGIIDRFNMLYQVFPVIKQEDDVVIPAAI